MVCVSLGPFHMHALSRWHLFLCEHCLTGTFVDIDIVSLAPSLVWDTHTRMHENTHPTANRENFHEPRHRVASNDKDQSAATAGCTSTSKLLHDNPQIVKTDGSWVSNIIPFSAAWAKFQLHCMFRQPHVLQTKRHLHFILCISQELTICWLLPHSNFKKHSRVRSSLIIASVACESPFSQLCLIQQNHSLHLHQLWQQIIQLHRQLGKSQLSMQKSVAFLDVETCGQVQVAAQHPWKFAKVKSKVASFQVESSLPV